MSDYDAIECTLCGYYYMRHHGACPNCYPEQASNTTGGEYVAIAYPNKLDSAVKAVEKAQKGVSKQRSKKVSYDGYTFDSTKECERYKYLYSLQVAGDIFSLTVHPKFVLLPSFTLPATPYRKEQKQRGITYEADFSYYLQDDFYIVEDYKATYGNTKKNIAKGIAGKPIISEDARLRHKLLAVYLSNQLGIADWHFRIVTDVYCPIAEKA